MTKGDKGCWRFRVTFRQLPVHEAGFVSPTGSERGIDVALAWRDNDGTDDEDAWDAIAWFRLADARAFRDELDRAIVTAEEHMDEEPPTDESREFTRGIDARLLRNFNALNEMVARGVPQAEIDELSRQHGLGFADVVAQRFGIEIPSVANAPTTVGRSRRAKKKAPRRGAGP